MEMVSIPLEQYQEFLQMRLELHLIYTKCSEEVAYDTGICCRPDADSAP